MKKINILLAVIMLLSYIGCEKDFLDRYPYDKKVVGNFYQTPQDAFEALVAVYDVLQGAVIGDNDYDNIILISEIASDNCFGGAGANDDLRLQVWDDFEDLFYNPHALQWRKYYRGIYRANVFLENVDNVEWGSSEDLKNRYIAECRFLRAYFYFDLVRLFGHIPLLTEVVDAGNLKIPQADPEDVYKFIAEDLKYAIDNLQAVPYQGIPTYEYGRVTKWAAEALLGRVFLYYTGYYNKSDIAGIVTKSDARTYIDDVINNSGHALVDTFEYLWQYSFEKFVGEDNEETVFTIKYTYKDYGDYTKRDGNRWQVMIGLRNQVIIPYASGWGAATVNPELWNAYDTSDTRREGSILGWDELGITFETIDQREYTGYNWRKFVPLTDTLGNLITENYGGNFMRDNYFDYPVIRYSDVLLMGAELHLDDNLGLAQSYYDKVRDRAFLDNQHRKTLTGNAAGMSLIMEERRLELAFEGHRYYDLLRQGGLADNLSVAKAAIDCGDPYPVTFRPETEGVFEIPPPEIVLSDETLIQNPGWK
jgi:hypothetical protein